MTDEAARPWLILYVGVRWFGGREPGRLAIDVWIDDVPVSAGERFPTPSARKRPDSFSVALSPGRHRLLARAGDRGVDFRQDFEMAGGMRFAQLAYEQHPLQPGSPRDFTWEIQDRDFGWR